MPQGIELEIGSMAGIPLYDGDMEAAQGISAVVESLKRKTPEYKTLHAGGAEKRHGLAVAPAGGVFNEAGELADEAVRTQLQKYLAGFVAFIKG